VEPQRFPPDLLDRARTAIERHGYCIFDAAELERVLSHIPASHPARQHALEEFADACGATVETTRHFTSARFVKIESNSA
jgi:hypothetical protein